MSQTINISIALAKGEGDPNDPLGSYISTVGRHHLHLLGVFRVLKNPPNIIYYNDTINPEEYDNINKKFIPSDSLDAPAFDYEYCNHRYKIQLGTVDGKRAMKLSAHEFCEIYVVKPSRSIYVSDTTLYLNELSDIVFAEDNALDLTSLYAAMQLEGTKLKLPSSI